MPHTVLDSFALLAYLRREPNHETVVTLLKKAALGKEAVCMTEANYAEVKYIVLRKDGVDRWEAVEKLLESLPIRFYPVDHTLANQAAEFKARFKLSLADACAAALAKALCAVLYTDDSEFEALSGEIRLHMMGQNGMKKESPL